MLALGEIEHKIDLQGFDQIVILLSLMLFWSFAPDLKSLPIYLKTNNQLIQILFKKLIFWHLFNVDNHLIGHPIIVIKKLKQNFDSFFEHFIYPWIEPVLGNLLNLIGDSFDDILIINKKCIDSLGTYS